VTRKSSSRLNRLIVSHSLFSIFANPVRYVWLLSLIFVLLGSGFFLAAVVLFGMRLVSAYTALFGLSLSIVGMVLFVLGVVLKQGNIIQRELWLIQQRLLSDHRVADLGAREAAEIPPGDPRAPAQRLSSTTGSESPLRPGSS
jgi:hypothetical protein